MIKVSFILLFILSHLFGQVSDWNPDEMHRKAMEYPSAMECATCHPKQTREWSVSPHAYTQMSPVFNAMTGFVGVGTNGTNGDFCMRCHTPAGMAMGEPIFMDNPDREQVSREGITCIACHKVNRNYGRVSGRQHIKPGDVFTEVYGPEGGEELARVQELPEFQLASPDNKKGMAVHLKAEKFFEMSEPSFCGTCHEFYNQVGLRNQETLSEYRHSQSAKDGISCQDCHMGKSPGVSLGDDSENYEYGPAAIVNGKPTKTRKLTNHMMAGPDHTLIHPGLFPLNPQAKELAEVDDWTKFDWKSGWGTDEFEDEVDDNFEFPEVWENYDDRADASEIIRNNLDLINEYMEQRLALLKNGYNIGEIEVSKATDSGIKFKVKVENITEGHSVPTGFSIRPLYLRVEVTDESGNTIFQSGDLDPNGDFRDEHSLYVQHGQLGLDPYLFNLQPKFTVRNIRGGERTEPVPVNYSGSPLPFIRPFPMSFTLAGRPKGLRIKRHGIQTGGHRWAKYKVKGNLLTGSENYNVNVKLIAPMIPVNLINTIKDMGFEYNMTAKQLADRVVSGHTTVWEYSGVIKLNSDIADVDWSKIDNAPFKYEDLK
jgi:hypothetical protein